MKLSNALILIGHGSREKGFADAMKKVAGTIRKEKKFDFVLCAYNEIVAPSFAEAVEILVKKGVKRISVLPYFLQAGRHVRCDIPEFVTIERKKYSGKVKIILCPYLGFDKRIVNIVRDRIGTRGDRYGDRHAVQHTCPHTCPLHPPDLR